MTRQYRGFVSFASSNAEFRKFVDKINRYYEWCRDMGLDDNDDENYNSFCEGEMA